MTSRGYASGSAKVADDRRTFRRSSSAGRSGERCPLHNVWVSRLPVRACGLGPALATRLPGPPRGGAAGGDVRSLPRGRARERGRRVAPPARLERSFVRGEVDGAELSGRGGCVGRASRPTPPGARGGSCASRRPSHAARPGQALTRGRLDGTVFRVWNVLCAPAPLRPASRPTCRASSPRSTSPSRTTRRHRPRGDAPR